MPDDQICRLLQKEWKYLLSCVKLRHAARFAAPGLMKTLSLLSVVALGLPAVGGAQEWNFQFASDGPKPDHTAVSRNSAYTSEKGFGWLPDQPSVFAADVPEGNYDVTVHFRSPAAAAASTVKAEDRRLMLTKEALVDGATRRFTVNVSTPEIEGGGRVGNTQREPGPPPADWDNRLTLEFLGEPEAVTAVEIAAAADPLVVFVAGDSTVTNQPDEPWGGWGQMLPRFFTPGVSVTNYAASGRALYSFRGEKRLQKILSQMKKGDYLLIQFGHNDQKDKSPGSGPFTTYKKNLKQYIAAVRAKDGLPVLVTPMERRRWKDGKPQETLTDFAEAVRQVGKEENVPVIDLHAMSLKFYEALGPDKSKQAFVHYPANTFPKQPQPLKDDTHHNTYGAYELARCVVEGIKEKVPNLAEHLRKDVGSFDPSKPDQPEDLQIPPSGAIDVKKPAGN